MCGAAACALSASMLSHFSMARNVSGPHFACNGSAFSASIAAPYSIQPISERTAGTLARKAARISARLPGLAVMTAMTWIMALLLEDDELRGAAHLAEHDRVLLEELPERLGVGAVDADHEEARLGPAAEGIAPLAPEVRVARGGHEALQRGVGNAVLGVGALLTARVGGGDDRGRARAFGADQLVDVGIGL